MVINQVEFPKNGKQRLWKAGALHSRFPLQKEIMTKTLFTTCAMTLQYLDPVLGIELKFPLNSKKKKKE